MTGTPDPYCGIISLMVYSYWAPTSLGTCRAVRAGLGAVTLFELREREKEREREREREREEKKKTFSHRSLGFLIPVPVEYTDSIL